MGGEAGGPPSLRELILLRSVLSGLLFGRVVRGLGVSFLQGLLLVNVLDLDVQDLDILVGVAIHQLIQTFMSLILQWSQWWLWAAVSVVVFVSGVIIMSRCWNDGRSLLLVDHHVVVGCHDISMNRWLSQALAVEGVIAVGAGVLSEN